MINNNKDNFTSIIRKNSNQDSFKVNKRSKSFKDIVNYKRNNFRLNKKKMFEVKV